MNRVTHILFTQYMPLLSREWAFKQFPIDVLKAQFHQNYERNPEPVAMFCQETCVRLRPWKFRYGPAATFQYHPLPLPKY